MPDRRAKPVGRAGVPTRIEDARDAAPGGPRVQRMPSIPGAGTAAVPVEPYRACSRTNDSTVSLKAS
jgi:hypothetical protein